VHLDKNIALGLSVFSGLAGMLGFVPYIIAILRKHNPIQPQKASWVAWGILNFITLAGMYVKGVATIQMAAITLGSWVVLGLSFKYGKAGWSNLDKFCLITAIFAIAFWKYFGDSDFGIEVSLVGFFISGLPTWKSAWQTPEKEDRQAWTIFALSSLAALLAIQTFTMASVAQPIEFLVNQAVTTILLFTRPRSTAKDALETTLD
jgi:hypothetical protein